MKFCIIGLGNFGLQLVRQLNRDGHEIIAVDNDPIHINALKDEIEYLIQADCTNLNAFHEIPVAQCDAVILAIGENFEASLSIASNLQQLGAKRIISRIINPLHGRLLKLLKIDETMIPEAMAAAWLARSLKAPDKVSSLELGVVRDEMQNITFLAEADIQTIFDFVGHIAFKIVIHNCGIMIVLGLLDMLYIKWQYIEKLKMTKQEVKDEHKESEGNPEVKGKIKKMQYQMARRRMTKIIPLADVVITNPTHFAVALKYDRQKMVAPVVLAKGMDIMAEAIKKIAREHSVTLVENRFLARELYDQVEENEPIPEALYAAVAEVLAYVYKMKGKT